ncbi:unnamed protein product [Closterium sp. Yama58-4]|nr:unnamed protein product [Closterium sp. Yama58-4]
MPEGVQQGEAGESAKGNPSFVGTALSQVVKLFLLSQLESCDDLSVTVSGSNRELLSGRIVAVNLSARGAVYKGVRLTSVHVAAANIAVDARGQAQSGSFLCHKFPVHVKALVSEGDFNESLQNPAFHKPLSNLLSLSLPLEPSSLRVRFSDGSLHLYSPNAPSLRLTPKLCPRGRSLEFDRRTVNGVNSYQNRNGFNAYLDDYATDDRTNELPDVSIGTRAVKIASTPSATGDSRTTSHGLSHDGESVRKGSPFKLRPDLAVESGGDEYGDGENEQKEDGTAGSGGDSGANSGGDDGGQDGKDNGGDDGGDGGEGSADKDPSPAGDDGGEGGTGDYGDLDVDGDSSSGGGAAANGGEASSDGGTGDDGGGGVGGKQAESPPSLSPPTPAPPSLSAKPLPLLPLPSRSPPANPPPSKSPSPPPKPASPPLKSPPPSPPPKSSPSSPSPKSPPPSPPSSASPSSATVLSWGGFKLGTAGARDSSSSGSTGSSVWRGGNGVAVAAAVDDGGGDGDYGATGGADSGLDDVGGYDIDGDYSDGGSSHGDSDATSNGGSEAGREGGNEGDTDGGGSADGGSADGGGDATPVSSPPAGLWWQSLLDAGGSYGGDGLAGYSDGGAEGGGDGGDGAGEGGEGREGGEVGVREAAVDYNESDSQGDDDGADDNASDDDAYNGFDLDGGEDSQPLDGSNAVTIAAGAGADNASDSAAGGVTESSGSSNKYSALGNSQKQPVAKGADGSGDGGGGGSGGGGSSDSADYTSDAGDYKDSQGERDDGSVNAIDYLQTGNDGSFDDSDYYNHSPGDASNHSSHTLVPISTESLGLRATFTPQPSSGGSGGRHGPSSSPSSSPHPPSSSSSSHMKIPAPTAPTAPAPPGFHNKAPKPPATGDRGKSSGSSGGRGEEGGGESGGSGGGGGGGWEGASGGESVAQLYLLPRNESRARCLDGRLLCKVREREIRVERFEGGGVAPLKEVRAIRALCSIYMGHWNLQASLQDLLVKRGMSQGTDALVGGCSAGAVAVSMVCDPIAAWLARYRMRTKCFMDAGVFPDVVDYYGQRSLRRKVQRMAGAQNINRAGISYSCKQSLGSSKEAWKCFFPEYNLNFVRTPMFLVNSLLDYKAVAVALALALLAAKFFLHPHSPSFSLLLSPSPSSFPLLPSFPPPPPSSPILPHPHPNNSPGQQQGGVEVFLPGVQSQLRGSGGRGVGEWGGVGDVMSSGGDGGFGSSGGRETTLEGTFTDWYFS